MKKIVFLFLICGFFTITTHSVFAEGYTGESENWAGYVGMNGPFTQVSGSWVVPIVASSDTDKISSEWIGIGGINSNDLLQSGTEQISRNGGIDNVAWYEALPDKPHTIPLRITARDRVAVSLNYEGSNIWKLSFRNLTTAESFEQNINYNSSFSSSEWIEERPQIGSDFLPNADFGTVLFENGSVIQNGVKQSLVDIQARPLFMAEKGIVLARPSRIGSDRSTFSVSIPGSVMGITTPLEQLNMSMPTVIEPNTNRVSSGVVTLSVTPLSITSNPISSEAIKIQIMQAIILKLQELIRALQLERMR